MARILGIVVPDENKVDFALTKLYGIGWSRSLNILDTVGIDKNKKIGQLNEDEIKKIVNFIEDKYKVEGALREELRDNLKRLRDISSYRGYRHARGLPTRGQRTRSNARTLRGKRRTVGALTKEAWSKIEQQAPAKKE